MFTFWVKAVGSWPGTRQFSRRGAGARRRGLWVITLCASARDWLLDCPSAGADCGMDFSPRMGLLDGLKSVQRRVLSGPKLFLFLVGRYSVSFGPPRGCKLLAGRGFGGRGGPIFAGFRPGGGPLFTRSGTLFVRISVRLSARGCSLFGELVGWSGGSVDQLLKSLPLGFEQLIPRAGNGRVILLRTMGAASRWPRDAKRPRAVLPADR
jgi:hypothetical protein